MHYSVCKPRIRLQPVVIPTVDFCFPLPEQPKIEKVERAVIEIDNSPNPQTTSTTTEVPPSILKNQLKMVQAQRTESQPVTSQIASKLASSQPTPTSTVTSKPSVTSATPQLAGILDEPVSISTAINTSQGMSINPSGFSIIYGSARDFYCKSIRFQFSIHLTLAIVLNKTLKLKTRLRAIFFSHCLFMVRLWPSSSMSTDCVLLLREDWAIFCHAGSGRVDSVRSAGKDPSKYSAMAAGIEPWPRRGQTVRCVISPIELSWPGPQRGQTVRYIHFPTELSRLTRER